MASSGERREQAVRQSSSSCGRPGRREVERQMKRASPCAVSFKTYIYRYIALIQGMPAYI